MNLYISNYIFCFCPASLVPPCDLNMMLIQVKAEVTPLWYEYGEMLGVPQEILNQLRAMDTDDYDKLVEILDVWFMKFPVRAGPSWKEVALSLREIGLNELAANIMRVYTTGKEETVFLPPFPLSLFPHQSMPPPKQNPYQLWALFRNILPTACAYRICCGSYHLLEPLNDIGLQIIVVCLFPCV